MPAYAQMRKSVFRVSYELASGASDWGTCFPVMTSDGPRFVTAAHVFDAASKSSQLDLSFCSPAFKTIFQTSMIQYLGCDLALISPCWVKPAECLPVRQNRSGDMFVAVGYARVVENMPDCSSQSEMKGVIDADIQFRDCPAYLLNTSQAAVGHGMSGGPVFEMNSSMEGEEVLGVLLGKVDVQGYSHPIVTVRLLPPCFQAAKKA